jgi:PPOX class probable F420-dependent enzyme
VPRPPLPAELHPFLAQPNVAVLATLRADGSLSTTGTWYLWEPTTETFTIGMKKDTPRERNLRRHPRIGLTVLSTSGMDHVSVSGAVTTVEDDAGFAVADRLSLHYTGEPHPWRGVPALAVSFTPTSWHRSGDPVAASRR